MSVLRYGIAVAAICSGVLVAPMSAVSSGGADAPQQATTPMAVPPTTPYGQQPTTRPAGVLTADRQGASWDAMGMRGFSVALVVGDLTGTATADNLPAGAKKALSDMRDFLPYKSYRLLDTHWILCCQSHQTTVSGRLRGPESDESEYSFNIYVRPLNERAELGITFSLRESGMSHVEQVVMSAPSSAERTRRMSELIHKRDELERSIADNRTKYGERHPTQARLQDELEAVRRQLGELDRGSPSRPVARSTRPVLDSTFSMKVGETVVIGTSRLKGDKALIALLTAASRNATTPPRERN